MKRVSIEPLIDGYLAYCADVRRRAPRTVIDMRCTFSRLRGFIAEQRPGKEPCKLSLDDFLRWVEVERESGQSVKSIAKELSHIRGFLNYAWRSGRIDRNVLDGFCLQDACRSSPPLVLTIEEVSRLVKACDRRTPMERRDRLIILLLYGCGLRTGDLCGLGLQEVDRERQELFVRKAKGKVERMVPYVRDNFLNGRSFADLNELNAQAQHWLTHTANARIHATTSRVPADLLAAEGLTSVTSIAPYQLCQTEARRANWKGYVRFARSRYSVPPECAGRPVIVTLRDGKVIIRSGDMIVAEHEPADKPNMTVATREHVESMWKLSVDNGSPLLPHWIVTFDESVQRRALETYEEVTV